MNLRFYLISFGVVLMLVGAALIVVGMVEMVQR
jgi:hypothetical protein